MSQHTEDNKRIAKNTFILYIRMLFTIAVGLYTSRVILATLGITDYGIYNIVGGIVTMFGFINSAMSGASSRFITFELGTGNQNSLNKIFGQSLSVHLCISLLILVLSETIGLWFIYEKVQIPTERFFPALVTYHLSIAASILSIMSVPYNAVIIAHEKMSAFAYITISDVILKLVIVYLLNVFPYDKLIVYAILLFIAQIINQAIYCIYSWKTFPEVKTGFVWDSKLFKNMASFAGWSMFGNLAAVLFGQGLNILLNLFFGPIVNAARGIAVQVQGVVSKFISSFQTALNPQITKNYASGELSAMHKLIFTSSKFSFFLMMMLSLPVLINTEYLLKIWLKNVPDYTVIFVRLMLLISILDTLANPLMVAIQATGRIRVYQQIVGGILLAILPISYVTLKLGAPAYSVFIVHLLCAIVAQGARIYLISPMIHLVIKEYVKKVIAKIFIVFILSITLSFLFNLLPYTNINFIRFILNSIIYVAISISAIYYLGLDKNEKVFLTSKISTLFTKRK